MYDWKETRLVLVDLENIMVRSDTNSIACKLISILYKHFFDIFLYEIKLKVYNDCKCSYWKYNTDNLW